MAALTFVSRVGRHGRRKAEGRLLGGLGSVGHGQWLAGRTLVTARERSCLCSPFVIYRWALCMLRRSLVATLGHDKRGGENRISSPWARAALGPR